MPINSFCLGYFKKHENSNWFSYLFQQELSTKKNMLLDLLEELVPSVLSLLCSEDLKQLSLCSKHFHDIVTPWLWRDVRVYFCQLLQPIPNKVRMYSGMYFWSFVKAYIPAES